jgi:hypothetical protein
MFYSEIFYKKTFKNKISKQAYLEACKWLALNVYSKVELSKLITVNILKQSVKKGQLPAFVVTLYVNYDEDEDLKEYCHKCRQLHSLLYSIDKPNCELCKLSAFCKVKHEHLALLKQTVKEIVADEEQIGN